MCPMKASASPRTLLIVAILAASTAGMACAQDALVLTNGQRREVQVIGVTGDRLVFKSGPAETSLPLAQIEAVKMAAPKNFEQVLEMRKGPDAAKALPILKTLVEKFRGLPSPWAERASAMLGDAMLDAGDVAGAEAAFTAFQSAYPKAQSLADLGLARLALEKKDYATAGAKAAPMVEAARQTLFAGPRKSAEYGQACFIMGAVLEEQGKLPEALETYLLATTVFYEDQTVAAKARARADALASEKNVSVP